MGYEKIRILMPLRDGHALAPDVLRGIAMQNAPCELVCVSRARNYDQRISEAESRNILREYASEPYAIMMDSDVVFLGSDDVQRMVDGIKKSDKDVLAYNTKGTGQREKLVRDKHIPIACTIWKTEKLQSFLFVAESSHKCLCGLVNAALKIDFVDDTVLREVR